MSQRLETTSQSAVVLSSDWGGSLDKPALSKHLIASFYQVTKDSQGVWQPASSPTVKAPLTEASMQIALSWSSPFEDAGVDKIRPTITSMLQTGMIQPYLKNTGLDGGKISGFFSEFEGRTGITKLNSTQVFAGMPPVRIEVTALFRAWLDPVKEVEAPVNQLMEWALPEELAADGAIPSIINGIKLAYNDGPDRSAAIAALLPSTAPVMVAMQYKGRTFSPLVVENIVYPLSSPIDQNGNFTEISLPMTLCTLTAFDRKDWSSARQL